MRGLLSLDQELRAARRVKGQENATQSNHPPEPRETERPWQKDIDVVLQTMREVLRAVASLSGVELPGLPPGLQDDGALPPRLDVKNLKDRFRNDLEGFSIKTTEELAKRAKEQTRAALDTIQNEVGGRIDQIAAELREKLQLPAQIEKLLEPSVEEAGARLERSLSQKVEQLFAEQEQLVQEKLQGALSPVQAQVSTVEEAEARLERSLSQKVEQLFAEQEQLVEERLQGALSPVQAQISTLEQTVQQIRELKADSVVQSPAERPNEAVDNAMGKYESRVDCGVGRVLDQAFSSIEWSLSDFRETPKIQLAQSTVAGLEEQRKVISFDNTDRESRVQQALETLGRLGQKNPHPESRVESLKATP
jgi:hypothetical protein